MLNERAEEYIKDGCHLENAIIESAEISSLDIPTVDLVLKLPHGGVVFGGVCFGGPKKDKYGESYISGWDRGMTIIYRMMQIAGVSEWSMITNKPVRAVMKGNRIVAVGHFMKDIFLDYKKPFYDTNEGKE